MHKHRQSPMLETIASIIETNNKEMELAAIWLDHSLQYPDGKKRRFTEGDEVTLVDNKLVDYNGAYTHKVVGCYGTVNSARLSFVMTDLATHEPIGIALT